MSIATEQKVERLLKRMDDLECEVSELRGQLGKQHESACAILAELRVTQELVTELRNARKK